MRALLLTLLVGCAVGDGEPAESQFTSAVTACPASTWCVETSPSSSLLHGVWAASADDVFAVGGDGVILRRTNDTWTAMASPTGEDLRGVWGTSSSDVWAAGENGAIVHFDGTAWSAVQAVTFNLESVWGSSSSDVWFAGLNNAVHWNGSAFSLTPISGTFLSVSGTGPSDAWMSGEASTSVRHFNGSTWTALTPLAGATLNAVLAVGTNDVWVSDFTPGKEVAHWNGSKWTTAKTGGGFWNGMSALSTSDIWGVYASRVGHWDGSAWTVTQPLGTNAVLWSVTTPPGNAWVVGSNGVIAHRSL